MLKKHLLTMMLALCSLLGWATEWNYTFTTTAGFNSKNLSQELNGRTWTFSKIPEYIAGGTKIGIQLGSANNPAGKFTISSDDFSESITKVVVEAKSRGKGTIDVSVGGETFGTTATLTGDYVEYAFEGEANGTISLGCNFTSAAAYIRSITITYADLSKLEMSYGIESYEFERGMGDAESFTGQTLSLGDEAYASDITYSSSDTTVIVVDEKTGVARYGNKAGTAIIKASFPGNEIYTATTASYTVTWRKQSTSLSFESASYTFSLGSDEFKNFDGQAVVASENLKGQPITYESSDRENVGVDDNGKVTLGNKYGSYTITAKFAETDILNAASASYIIHVIDTSTKLYVDTLKASDYTVGTTYTDFSDIKKASGAIYAGNASRNSSDAMMLRDTEPSGIITTSSGGNVKSITIKWNSNTSGNRVVYVYGLNKAYKGASDLYSTVTSTRGTLIARISKDDEQTKEISGEYQYIGILANGGTIYLDEIQIEWEHPKHTRNTSAGNYGTICLPRAVNADDIEGARIYSIAGVLKNGDILESIVMEEVTDGMEAGKGYIFQATASEQTFVMTGASVAAVAEGAVVGNLGEGVITVPSGSYVIYNNLVRRINGGRANVMQYYAYLNLDGVTEINEGESSVRGLTMLGSYDFVTAINGVEDEKQDAVVYDLSGRRVKRHVRKGIYIVNGRKVIK